MELHLLWSTIGIRDFIPLFDGNIISAVLPDRRSSPAWVLIQQIHYLIANKWNSEPIHIDQRDQFHQHSREQSSGLFSYVSSDHYMGTIGSYVSVDLFQVSFCTSPRARRLHSTPAWCSRLLDIHSFTLFNDSGRHAHLHALFLDGNSAWVILNLNPAAAVLFT